MIHLHICRDSLILNYFTVNNSLEAKAIPCLPQSVTTDNRKIIFEISKIQ